MRVMHAGFLLLSSSFVGARQDPGEAVAPAPERQGKAFSDEQLEQLVAPIALYPDPLLSQILMAATYPVQVVEAERWVQKNPGLSSGALESKLRDRSWDPSVKSLCGLPDVLERMSENLDWTQDLGDAFLGQQAQLMDTVQRMRQKAYAAGTLESGNQIQVTERDDMILVIQETDPEVIYVPTYYPTAVYGSWTYPTWYYPSLYVPPPAGGFALGFATGAAWASGMWGSCDWRWGHTDIDVDVDRYNNFVDHTEIDARRGDVKARVGPDGRWQHDPANRGGVRYRNSDVAQRYGAAQGRTRVPRDQARGYGNRDAPSPGGWGLDRLDGGARPAARSGGWERAGDRSDPSARPRVPNTTGTSSGAFSGARSPGFDRDASWRGASSRGDGGAGGGFGGRFQGFGGWSRGRVGRR